MQLGAGGGRAGHAKANSSDHVGNLTNAFTARLVCTCGWVVSDISVYELLNVWLKCKFFKVN
jgi:hypothetical protein